MKSSASIVKISVALLKAQKEMPLVKKDSTNPHFGSSFASLEAVLEVTKEVLNRNGIVVLQPHGVSEHGPYVETILLHESGEYISGHTPIVSAKHDPQATGSAITYARRYGLKSITGLSDDDDDANAAQGKSAQPQTAPKKPQTSQYDDLNNYVVTFGKFKGKRLSEISDQDLRSYARYLEKTSEGQPVSQATQSFLGKINEFLSGGA